MPHAYPSGPPGAAHHIIQPLRSSAAPGTDGIDRARCLQDVRDIARRRECLVHAYVLMADRIHLLLTPRAVGDIVRILQVLEQCGSTRFDNPGTASVHTARGRRYRAHRVVAERDPLRCQRDIELQPVRAGIVADPVSYRWSSHRHHVLGLSDRWLVPHRALLALGRNPHERRERYRRLVMEAACGQRARERRGGSRASLPDGADPRVLPCWTSGTS